MAPGVSGHRGLPSGGKIRLPPFHDLPPGRPGQGLLPLLRGFNLFRALEACADLLEGFGGHALAAGFTIREENIPAFRPRMNAVWRPGPESTRWRPPWTWTRSWTRTSSPWREVEGLDLLEPYGAGNPKPVFSLSGCTCFRRGRGGRRAAPEADADRGRPSLDAIFFSATAAEAGVARATGWTWLLPPDQRVPG